MNKSVVIDSKYGIPEVILFKLAEEYRKVTHGSVFIEIMKHDNDPRWYDAYGRNRYVIGKPMSGSVHGKKKETDP